MKTKPVATNTITLDEPFIAKNLLEKNELIQEGRALSKKIDELQKEIDECVKKEHELTATVEPKDLIEAGEKLKDAINVQIKELEKIGTAIREAKLKAIPKELEKKHLELNNNREKLEKERNVIGLKVQKIKDRVIPKIQKIAQKHLGEYEDLFSADVKDGKVVIQKFSHLAEWKRVWESQHKK